MRTTQRKGDIAVTQAVATFTRLGYDVSLPVTESAAYDMIVDWDGQLVRIQCKYSTSGDVDMRLIHSNSTGYVTKGYKENSFDWLYVYSPGNGEFIYKNSLLDRRSIRISKMEKLA